jgi:hypothetical protein
MPSSYIRFVPGIVRDRIFGSPDPQATEFLARLEDGNGIIGWRNEKERWACFGIDPAIVDSLASSGKASLGREFTAILDSLSRRSPANSQPKRTQSAIATMPDCRIFAVNHVVPTEMSGALAKDPDVAWFRDAHSWGRVYAFAVKLEFAVSREEEEVAELQRCFGRYGRRLTHGEATSIELGIYGANGDYESPVDFSDRHSLTVQTSVGPERLTVLSLGSISHLAPGADATSVGDYQTPPQSAFTALRAIRTGSRLVWMSFKLEPAKLTWAEVNRRVQSAQTLLDTEHAKVARAGGRAATNKHVIAAQTARDTAAAVLALIDPTGDPYLMGLRVYSAWELNDREDATRLAQTVSGQQNAVGTWVVLEDRMRDAVASSQPCGPAGPGRGFDIRADYIGRSQLFTLSKGGDKEGAHAGWSKADRQRVRLDPAGTHRGEGPLWQMMGGTGAGKRLSLDTKLPTPFGWTTVGDLVIGDTLLGPDGKPTRVRYLSPIAPTPDLYEVVFDDGQVVAADAEHLWEVGAFKHRDRKFVKTTAELSDSLIACNGGSNWSIALPVPFEGITAALPLDPYLLGFWLGGGCREGAGISTGERDVEEVVTALSSRWRGDVTVEKVKSGFRIFLTRRSDSCPRDCASKERYHNGSCKSCASVNWSAEAVTDVSLRTTLKALGLMPSKRIPATYLFASYEQRCELLRGLLDSDGTIDTRGRCDLSLSDRSLAGDAVILIRSLGIKASFTTSESAYKDDAGYRVRCKDRTRIHFTTALPVFTLQRHLARLPVATNDRTKRLYVKSILPIAPRPARCLQVDNESHLFLCADFVPTHNTHLAQSVARMLWRMGWKQVYINLKGEGDTRVPAFRPMGATTRTISDMGDQDGPMDPFRANFQWRLAEDDPERMFTSEEIMESARSYILTALFPNLSGNDLDLFVGQLGASFKAAAVAGATCVTEALDSKFWKQDENSPIIRERVHRATNLAVSDTIVRVCIGEHPLPEDSDGASLNFSAQTTLIEPGRIAWKQNDPKCAALLVMVLTQAGIALRATKTNPNGGICWIDEAHVMTGIEACRNLLLARLRIYRQHFVTICLMSQRPEDMGGFGDFSRATMVGYFKTDDTDGAKQAAAALAMIGAPEGKDLTSFRADVDKNTGKVLAPSTWLIRTEKQEPVEIVVETPPAWNVTFKAAGVAA